MFLRLLWAPSFFYYSVKVIGKIIDMPLSVEVSVRAESLIDDGQSYKYVVDSIGASIGSTTEKDDRFMKLEVLRDWHTTVVQVQVTFITSTSLM
mgnify:CR=1 FL=1